MEEKVNKNTWFNLAKKHVYLLFIISVLSLTPIFAWHFGFGDISLIEPLDNRDVARLLATMTFPLTGIMVFVLNQILELLAEYSSGDYPLTHVVTTYTYIGVAAIATVIESAVIGILSFQYFKSGGETLLTIAICLLLPLFVLLIVNTAFFFIYAMKNPKKNKRGLECDRINNDR